MTQSAESDRRQPAVPDRREIAKRIFDALCATYPDFLAPLLTVATNKSATIV